MSASDGAAARSGPGLGWRIALAAVIPAAVALGAMDWFAVRAARDAERHQVESRLEDAARVVEDYRKFFLAVPARSAEITARVARLSGFEFILGSGDGVVATSLPEGAPPELLSAVFPPDGHRELLAGEDGYLARRVDMDPHFLILLFPTAAVDQAGRRAALPVLLASLAGLLLVAVSAAVLGARLAGPVRRLAGTTARVASGGDRGLRADGASGPPEVRLLAGEINRMLDALERAEEERVDRERLAVLGEFAAGVAHEIRNPLSSLRLSLQLASRDCGEGVREDIDAALDEMARLERSADDLLRYAGGTPRPPAPFDPGKGLREAVALLRRQADHLGVELRVLVDDGVPATWTGDGDGFRSCVQNLALNALQAAPRSSAVEVRLRCAEAAGERPAALLLEVADGGPGVPPELRERVFEPFFSGRPGGTGLGLSLVRRLATAAGGSVVCSSGPAGTTFRLEWPSGRP